MPTPTNIQRTRDGSIIAPAVNQYIHEIVGFNLDDWTDPSSKNIALTNSLKDVALFEYVSPGVVSGHYFFWSRGAKAVSVGREMLREIFSGEYGVQVIQGLTPLDNPKARWVTRKLGFTSYGLTNTSAGLHEIVIMTKDMYSDV